MTDAEWIQEFLAALGDLGRNVPRATVLGHMVSVSIDVRSVGYTTEYDPRSDDPATSAGRFRDHVVRMLNRRKRRKLAANPRTNPKRP
jgi:hypothetical protein